MDESEEYEEYLSDAESEVDEEDSSASTWEEDYYVTAEESSSASTDDDASGYADDEDTYYSHAGDIQASLRPRLLSEYDCPYMDRDNENIRTDIESREEFSRCVSGPNPMKDVRVDPRFFNNQVLFQRIMYAYGSVALFAKMGAGKTGAIECYRAFMEEYHPGEISRYYYVTGKGQIDEFRHQIVMDFSDDAVRAEFVATTLNERGNRSYREILKDQENIGNNYLSRKMMETCTYGAMSALIDSLTNDKLRAMFNNAAVFIDEIQLLKITESVDKNVTPRPVTKVAKKKVARSGGGYERERMRIYKSLLRLTQICPNCKFSVLTGTPVTRSNSELSYILNLMPNTIKILTPLSWRIAESMANVADPDYAVPMPPPERWQAADADKPGYVANLEKVARGRIMYSRSPSTGAVEAYDESNRFRVVDWYPELQRTVTLVFMHEFQARTFIRVNNEMEQARARRGSRISPEKDTLYILCRQCCVFAIPKAEYVKMRLAGLKYEDIPEDIRMGLVSHENLKEIATVTTEKVQKEFLTKSYYQGKIARGESTTVDRKVYTPTTDIMKCFARNDILYELSAKFFDIVQHLENDDEGLIYCTSMFDVSTCTVLGWVLEARGYDRFRPMQSQWIDYKTERLLLQPAKRYAIMTSSNAVEHHSILRLAGHPMNWNGKYLRIIATSPIGTVGLNVRNCWRFITLDPPFTAADLDQSTARWNRPNAYKEIMKQLGIEQFGVKVSYYIAEIPDLPGVTDTSTTDWKIYQDIHKKSRNTARSTRAYKKIALDYKMNRGRNIREFDQPDTQETDYSKNIRYKAYPPLRKNAQRNFLTYNAYYADKAASRSAKEIGELITRLDFSAVNITMLLRFFSERGYTQTELLAGVRYIVENHTPIGHNRLGFPMYLEESGGTLYSTVYPARSSDRMLSYYYPLNTILATTRVERHIYDIIPSEVLEEHILGLELAEDVKLFLTTIPASSKAKIFELAITIYADELWAQDVVTALDPFYVVLEDGKIIHQVGNIFYKGANFDSIKFLLKANTNLRILEGGEWRWCTQQEMDPVKPLTTHPTMEKKTNPAIYPVTYSSLLRDKLERQMEPYYIKFHTQGFMGVIVRPDAVHIRYITLDKKTGKYVGDKGKKASNFPIQALLNMLYDMCGNTSPAHSLAKTSRSEMVNAVHKTISMSKAILNGFSDDKLRFFYERSQHFSGGIKVAQTKRELLECMAHRDAIYAAVGDVESTLHIEGAVGASNETREEDDEHSVDDVEYEYDEEEDM